MASPFFRGGDSIRGRTSITSLIRTAFRRQACRLKIVIAPQCGFQYAARFNSRTDDCDASRAAQLQRTVASENTCDRGEAESTVVSIAMPYGACVVDAGEASAL
jgi:hypothetical protein